MAQGQIDHWSRRESLEIDPNIYNCLTYDKAPL